jgi:hypothetical protein
MEGKIFQPSLGTRRESFERPGLTEMIATHPATDHPDSVAPETK